MATQRVLIVSIGGELADKMWQAVCQWSDSRMVVSESEWSSEDWTDEVRAAIDSFAGSIWRSAFTPPVLYRSEHVDCWSMGDVFDAAIVKKHPDYCRRLMSEAYEIIATWVRFSEQIILDGNEPPETRWLYNHLNEAFGAWGKVSEHRLVFLIRSVLGACRTDDEVIESLMTIPEWWEHAP